MSKLVAHGVKIFRTRDELAIDGVEELCSSILSNLAVRSRIACSIFFVECNLFVVVFNGLNLCLVVFLSFLFSGEIVLGLESEN